MAEDVPTIHSSRAEVWYLKLIQYGPHDKKKSLKIITQNYNGPCSFIAICNILILRGDIQILPLERQTVSYEFLSQLVAEYLLTNSSDVDISAALSIMPATQKGMDLNPLFIAATSFRPAGTGSGELKLFEQVGIKLVHGWLVDPDTAEARVLEKIQDYDTAVQLIAEVDHITNGSFVVNDTSIPTSGSSAPREISNDERTKIEDAIVVRRFLESTSSQLTYHGLFHLAAILTPGSLVALFRSSHLAVLYKSEGDDSALYTLVTDQIFLHEPSIVWERLEDVDGGWSTFVDSYFVRSSPAGGDFAGQSAEDALRLAEMEAGHFLGTENPADHELARQLQAEEDQLARQEEARHFKEEEERRAQSQAQVNGPRHKKPKKKKSDCMIM